MYKKGIKQNKTNIVTLCFDSLVIRLRSDDLTQWVTKYGTPVFQFCVNSEKIPTMKKFVLRKQEKYMGICNPILLS